MKISSGIIFALAAVFVFSAQVTAQAKRPERRFEEENRQALKPTEAPKPEDRPGLTLDYGGWENFRYITYHDEDNNSSAEDLIKSSWWVDSRLWLKATLKPAMNASYENEHYLYLRAKDLMIDNRPKDTAGGWDHDGAHMEYAYVSLDGRPFWLKAGRQYFSVGQGIAYSDVHDGAALIFLSPQWNIRTSASRSKPHEENIDLSVPGYDKHTDRNFYSLECAYTGVPEQNFYGYTVIQKDSSNAQPEDFGHDYRYNSEYFGLGAEGRIKSVFSYAAELIKETGTSFIYDTDEKKDMDAWAGRFQAAYEPDVYAHPNLSFEYAFGSGDADRASVTDTVSGNTAGRDRNFLYFGYIPTGYALFPRLSNLYFYRAGLSLRPLEKSPLFRHLSWGMNYFKFYKNKANGGISDPEATENSADIGDEIDVSLGWRILSDLGCTVQYGHFRPGKAYPDTSHDSEDYFSVSTTFTF
jgi:hypothetical protein